MNCFKQFIKCTLIGRLIKEIKLDILNYKWHKLNPDNSTTIGKYIDLNTIQVGKASYGKINAISYLQYSKLIIGCYVSIAENVTFLLDAEHRTDTISSYPFKVKILGFQNQEAFGKGDIIVDDDVWIGFGSTILSGVHIGQGAVVAAGAVVTKDIPPYAIVGGTPAQILKYRFSEEQIKKLLLIDYRFIDDELIFNHVNDLYDSNMKIEECLWLPKRENGE